MGISPEDCSLVLFVLFGRGWPEPNDLDSERAEADWTPSLGTYTGCAKIRFHFEGEHTYLDLYLILRVRFETACQRQLRGTTP